MRSLRRQHDLLEHAWQDWYGVGWDPRDQLQVHATGDRIFVPISLPTDRRHGDHWPLFRNHVELARLRQQSRIVCATSSFAGGLLDSLTNHVIGTGFQYKAGTKANLPDADPERPGVQPPARAEKLVARLQDFIDRWLVRTRWHAEPDPHRCQVVNESREREAYRRVLRDGEVFLQLFPQDDGSTDVRFIEPEWVQDPTSGQRADGWSYGIQHRMEPYEDVEKVLKYYVLHPAVPGSGEEVDAEEVVHVKMPGTDSTIKRGLPAFSYDTLDAFRRAGVLQRNLSMGAAIRAATAEIWQHETASKGEIEDLRAALAAYERTNPITGATEYVESNYPGMVRRIPMGQTLVPPPPSTGTPEHLQAAQGDIRQAATAFCAPEYLASADASNANYASTREAGTPFINAALARQTFFQAAFLEVLWRCVRHAVNRGLLERATLDLCEIQAEAPTPFHRDELQKSQKDQILVGLGAKSRQTVAMEEGLDWQQEQANNLEYQEQMGPQGAPLPMPGDDDGGPDQPPAGGVPQPATEALREEVRELRRQLRLLEGRFREDNATRPGEFKTGGGRVAKKGGAEPAKQEKPAAEPAPKQREKVTKPPRPLDYHWREPPPQLTATTAHLSQEQKDATKHYSTGAFRNINMHLRNPSHPLNEQDQAAARRLREALAQAPPLAEPVTVYRGVSLDAAQSTKLLDGFRQAQKAKTEVHMGGFVSTSFNKGVAVAFATDKHPDGPVLEIVARKGLYLGPSLSASPAEKELLLDHGSRFAVRGIRDEGGRKFVTLEHIL